jgi:hypothetical protein
MLSKATTIVGSPETLSSGLSPELVANNFHRPAHHHSATALELPSSRPGNRKASLAPPLAPPEPLRTSRSTPKLTPMYEELYEQVPPLLQKSHAPAMELKRRKETPTFYSTNSGSTKLGEIPMHRWQVPYDYDAASIMNREALANGWPRVDDQAGKKKKRGGFFGFFGRNKEIRS